MTFFSRASILALLDTLTMPLVLVIMGISGFGCMAWAVLILVFLTFGGLLQSGWLGLAIAAWTVLAVVGGFWNFGRYMAYFADGDDKLTGVLKAVGVSACIVLTNPFLWVLWLN